MNAGLFTTASEVVEFILRCSEDLSRALIDHAHKIDPRAVAKREETRLEAMVKARKGEIMLNAEGPEYLRKARADKDIVSDPIFHDYLHAVEESSRAESDYFTSNQHVENMRAKLEASRSISSSFKAEEAIAKQGMTR